MNLLQLLHIFFHYIDILDEFVAQMLYHIQYIELNLLYNYSLFLKVYHFHILFLIFLAYPLILPFVDNTHTLLQGYHLSLFSHSLRSWGLSRLMRTVKLGEPHQGDRKHRSKFQNHHRKPRARNYLRHLTLSNTIQFFPLKNYHYQHDNQKPIHQAIQKNLLLLLVFLFFLIYLIYHYQSIVLRSKK